MKLIDKDAVVAEIEKRKAICEKVMLDLRTQENKAYYHGKAQAYGDVLDYLDTTEVKEVDLYNNGWIDCAKQMPPETKQTSDTLQGHREWTESDMVLAWDSMYGCCVDATKNGKWMSEKRGGYQGQVVHGIIAWRPIPEWSEELLLKAQEEE